jgi:flagellar hook-associated protein 1 FlgK
MLPGDLVATGNLGAPATQGTITVTDGGSGSGIAGTVDLDYTADDNTIVKADIFDNSLVNKMQNALDSFLDNTFEVSVDGANHVTIESKSSNYTIGFGRDTSGALAALGLNTFFGGYDGGTVHVLDRIKNNPDQFAAAQTFVDGDNSNVADLMRLRETGILNNDTATTDDYYQGIVGRMGIEFDQTDNLLETHEDILVRVENQREDLSGVNLDEELAMMIQYQRTFQGAARFISTANTIYESLINM